MILIKVRKEMESFASNRLETNSKVPSLKNNSNGKIKYHCVKYIKKKYFFALIRLVGISDKAKHAFDLKGVSQSWSQLFYHCECHINPYNEELLYVAWMQGG